MSDQLMATASNPHSAYLARRMRHGEPTRLGGIHLAGGKIAPAFRGGDVYPGDGNDATTASGAFIGGVEAPFRAIDSAWDWATSWF